MGLTTKYLRHFYSYLCFPDVKNAVGVGSNVANFEWVNFQSSFFNGRAVGESAFWIKSAFWQILKYGSSCLRIRVCTNLLLPGLQKLSLKLNYNWTNIKFFLKYCLKCFQMYSVFGLLLHLTQLSVVLAQSSSVFDTIFSYNWLNS